MIYNFLNSWAWLFVLVIISCFWGMPLASLFVDIKDNVSNLWRGVYAGTILGISLYLLIVFIFMRILNCGTDKVAYPAAALLTVQSIVFILRQKQWIYLNIINKKQVFLFSLFFLLILFAATNIMYPILVGWWDMAYAVGDDASRWFMVVRYYREHPFIYLESLSDSLQWPAVERPLHVISGAAISSLLNTSQSASYSLSAAIANTLGAVSIIFLVESFVEIKKTVLRYLTWFLSIISFGVYGLITSYFYIGRNTHHFSLYPVLASFIIITFNNEKKRILAWGVLWSVLLANYYSVRYSVMYVFSLGVFFFLQFMLRQFSFIEFCKRVFLTFLILVAGIIVAFPESKLIYSTLMTSTEFISMQRGPRYGLDGTNLDVLFRWTGIVGFYQDHQIYSWTTKGLLLLIFSIIVIYSLIFAYLKRQEKSGILALIIFNLTAGFILMYTGKYYMAWKTSLYWPYIIFIGFFSACMLLLQKSERMWKFLGWFGVGIFVFFISFSWKQFYFFKEFVDSRYTKMDSTIKDLVASAKNATNCGANCRTKKIYGVDFTAERHLLLREFFHEFLWQPNRGQEVEYLGDVRPKFTEEEHNKYIYDLLLYAETAGCWPIDTDSNSKYLIMDSYPFHLYSSEASMAEFIDGATPAIWGWLDQKRCNLYYMNFAKNELVINFANHSKNKYLILELASSRELSNTQLKEIFKNNKTSKLGPVLEKVAEHVTDIYYYTAVLPLNFEADITKIILYQPVGFDKLAVSKIKWSIN